jgi:hypothetical protein
MLAESELIRKALNLTLPTVKNYFKFRVAIKEDYISQERFAHMMKNNFRISGDYFPQKVKAHSLIYADSLKRDERVNRLKIKLINNQKIQPVEFMTVKNLISHPTDIVIFTTGGGFIADMEKPQQYWLRRCPNQNQPEHLLPRLHHQVPSGSEK